MDKILSGIFQFILQNSKRNETAPYNKACSVGFETKTKFLFCEKDFPSFYSL